MLISSFESQIEIRQFPLRRVFGFSTFRSKLLVGGNPDSKSNSNLAKSPARGFLLNYIT